MRRRNYRKPDSVKILEELAFHKNQKRYTDFPYPVKRKYRDDKTNDLTRCIIDWIELNGYQAERINSTGRQLKINGNSKWIPGSSQKGTADISATIMGRSIKIEIKCAGTGDTYQSKYQLRYQKMIEQAGGIYLIIRNFTQFYEWYDGFITDAI